MEGYYVLMKSEDPQDEYLTFALFSSIQDWFHYMEENEITYHNKLITRGNFKNNLEINFNPKTNHFEYMKALKGLKVYKDGKFILKNKHNNPKVHIDSEDQSRGKCDEI